jgi:hypothetical protein
MLTSTWSITLYGIFFAPTFFISRFLTLSGRPKRDAAGAVIASGEDLNQPGLTEYAFDVIYVTCKKWLSHCGFDTNRIQGHVRLAPACSVTAFGGSILS